MMDEVMEEKPAITKERADEPGSFVRRYDKMSGSEVSVAAAQAEISQSFEQAGASL
jgi:hypothetical protein